MKKALRSFFYDQPGEAAFGAVLVVSDGNPKDAVHWAPFVLLER